MDKREEEQYYIEEIDDVTKEQQMLEQDIVKSENGNLLFQYVNHSDRAVNTFGRISDSNTTAYMNVALEYFGHRCALSGERFADFGEEGVHNSTAKSNLSAEHVIALCIGGDDVVPNLVPAVLQYNISKNGYYLLDWWNKQKDNEGKSLYTPYRLLKLVNYMLKSQEARGLDIDAYRELILTPNEIDIFLQEVEQQDMQEKNNSKRRILSDVITATTLDRDGKKLLTTIPEMEGSMPKQREQRKEKYDDINMMDIFLLDAINMLEQEKELSQVILKDKIGIDINIIEKLRAMYNKTIGTIPQEVEMRNMILQRIEELGIEENNMSIANGVLTKLYSSEMKEMSKADKQEYIDIYFENKIDLLKEILNEEQLQMAIHNIQDLFYDDKVIGRIIFYKENMAERLHKYLKEGTFNTIDEFIDKLKIIQSKGIDISNIPKQATIEILIKRTNASITREQIEEWGLDPEEKIGKIFANIKQGYRGKGSYKPPTEEQIKEFAQLGLFLDKVERDVNQEIIYKLKLMQSKRIDTSNIPKQATIEMLIKRTDVTITREQIEEWGLNPNEKIGQALQGIRQAYRGKGKYKPPTEEQVREFAQLGVTLDKVERDATQETIDKLKLMQSKEVDISSIPKRASIETIIRRTDATITREQIEEWGLEPGEKIGQAFANIKQAYRGKGSYRPPTEEQVKEFAQLGLSLDKVERDVNQETIDKLKMMQSKGIDVSNIPQQATIESIIKKTDATITREQIEEWGLEPGEKIGQAFANIKQAYRGRGTNNPPTEEQVKEFAQLGLLLDKVEKDVNQEIIDKLKIMQSKGINISSIPQRATIESIIKKTDATVTREQIEEWGLDPNEKIGKSFQRTVQAYRGKGTNKPPTEEQVKEFVQLGLALDKVERDVNQETIDKLELIQSKGIDISNISKQATIEMLIKRTDATVTREQIEEWGLEPNEKIGQTIQCIKQAYRGNGTYKSPTEEQVRWFAQLGLTLDKVERDVSQETINKLKLMQSKGVDISSIPQRASIETIIRRTDARITREQIEEWGLDPNEKIGQTIQCIKQAYRGKGTNKPPTKEQVKEFAKLGLSLERKNKSKDIRNASMEVCTRGCDEKKDFLEELERKLDKDIKER